MAADDEATLNRVRETLAELPIVHEKRMFGGVCFMVDEKLCICVRNDHIMCRLDPDTYTAELEKNDVEMMTMGGRVMKGYIYIGPAAMQKEQDFMYWINVALAYNKVAKASKKKS